MTDRTRRFTPFKPGKDHILYGRPAWNKGKKMPHSSEWEEKRIAAIREASKKRVHNKGYKRPPEHTAPMREGYLKWREADPSRSREQSLRNLSRDGDGNLSDQGSPNWKGGISKEWVRWRNKHWKQLENHRQSILHRDGCCKLCGSKDGLTVHHIIPVTQFKSAAFMEMNGITLCWECHRKANAFGGSAARAKKILPGSSMVVYAVIPHAWQAYNTIGNYDIADDGCIVIFISSLGNKLYEQAVLLHELVEITLIKDRGISVSDITAFDVEFENNRNNEFDEPGDDPSSPYHREHKVASNVERRFIEEVGEDWGEYERVCTEVFAARWHLERGSHA